MRIMWMASGPAGVTPGRPERSEALAGLDPRLGGPTVLFDPVAQGNGRYDVGMFASKHPFSPQIKFGNGHRLRFRYRVTPEAVGPSFAK
jgi:hypothetical protein